MRDALSMLDQCAGSGAIDADTVYAALGLAGNREIAEMLRHIGAHDTAAAVTLFGRLWQDGKDPATLLGELSALERDLLLCAVAPKGGNELLSGAYPAQLLDEFRGRFSAEALVNHIGVLQTALSGLRAGQAKTICELALVTLCEPALSDSLPALRERVAALEQAVQAGGIPVVPAPAEAPAPRAAAPAPPSPEPVPPPAPEPTPEQPEQPEQPEPVAVPVAAPVTATPAAPPSGGDAADVLQRAAKTLPIGLSTILTNPADVTAQRSGDLFLVKTASEFSRKMLDCPEVVTALTAILAADGRPAQVKFAVADAPERPAAEGTDKLSALEKFNIVTFQ
jgi:DNA polymerase III gamma/tau subunit